jgi:hypothetical protein
MNDQQLKHLLSATRPDGQDDGEEHVRMALDAARAKPELGAWLEEERGFDRHFTKNLKGIAPPPGLKDEILAGMALSAGGHDMGAGTVPGGSRADTVVRFPRSFSRMSLAAAAAVAILLSATALLRTGMQPQSGAPAATAQAAMVPPILTHLGNQLQPGNFPSLAMRSASLDELKAFLSSRKVPAPAEVPGMLSKKQPLGCVNLEFDHHPIGLVCFKNDETIHLFTLSAAMIGKHLPHISGAAYWQDGELAFRVWEANGQVMVLAMKGDLSTLEQLSL